MGAWADVIKVLRSSVFKDELRRLKPTKIISIQQGTGTVSLDNGVYLLYFINSGTYETCILPVSSDITSKASTSKGNTITFSKTAFTSTGTLSISNLSKGTINIREI